jgi:6-phosphogluconate dehydrogenase
MQLGMIGLGRMGAAMVERLLRAGHACVVYDRDAAAVAGLAGLGATGTHALADFAARLARPRVVWLMLPAAVVDGAIGELRALLEPGDIVIDGGNSHYHDDLRRAGELAAAGIHYLDVGTSGGVRGLERGYCLMIGGEAAVVQRLDPVFASLAPGSAGAPPTPGRGAAGGTAEQGYLHCGPSGAGHFVKMVHNAIEYGLMAAYAEGFNILHEAGVGAAAGGRADAETAPLREPGHYPYRFDLPEIAELWRRGSVIGSWLLDLTAEGLRESPDLARYAGRVADSGEGRWAVQAAIDEGVPTPVLSTALYARFSSRGGSSVADKLISAMRLAFGGHREKT